MELYVDITGHLHAWSQALQKQNQNVTQLES